MEEQILYPNYRWQLKMNFLCFSGLYDYFINKFDKIMLNINFVVMLFYFIVFLFTVY